jgi:hypothetical protein
MNTRNVDPIEISVACNGVVVRKKTDHGMCSSIKDTHVFNEKEDLFKFLEEYFVVSEEGDTNA